MRRMHQQEQNRQKNDSRGLFSFLGNMFKQKQPVRNPVAQKAIQNELNKKLRKNMKRIL